MSEIFKRITASLTPEKKEAMKQKRIAYTKSKTLEFQLGEYVGEYIVNRFLPTISTDSIRTNKCIEVSEEDKATNKQLEEDWFNSTKYGNNPLSETGNNIKWDKYREHSRYLESKYLPKTLTCYLSPLNIQNIEEFKKGLSLTLWDCDICHYNIEPENIKIYDDEDGYFTYIEFTLD